MSSLRQVPRRHSWLRRATFAALRYAAVGLGGRAFYRWNSLRAKRLVLRRETLCIPGLPKALEGLKILQLSDLHAGPFLRRGDLQALVAWAQTHVPDLLVLTGDYITDGWRDVERIVAELGQLPHRLGAFAVLGNHDYRGRHEAHIVRALAEQGIETLLDEGRAIADLPLWVSGLQDLEESRSALGASAAPMPFRAGRPAQAWELVLCHHPGGAPALAHERCLAVLAGHTHGRQVDWPGLRHLGPAHPGLQVRLMRGAREAGTLYVSRGLGVIGVPLRAGAPAEVLWLELRAAKGSQRVTHTRFGTLADA